MRMLAEWRRLLPASTTQGRTMLQRILRGRLVFTTHVNPFQRRGGRLRLRGADARFDELFTGIAVERPKRLEQSHVGTEGIGPEDTFEGGLRQAARELRESVASPTGFATTGQGEGPRIGGWLVAA